MVASLNGHRAVVQLLLEKGAPVNAKSNENITALLMASERGHKDIIQILLDKGADVNAKDSDGLSPVLLAAQKGYKDVVTLLLNQGADGNVRAKIKDTEYTLLTAAESHKWTDIVERLKKSGVKE